MMSRTRHRSTSPQPLTVVDPSEILEPQKKATRRQLPLLLLLLLIAVVARFAFAGYRSKHADLFGGGSGSGERASAGREVPSSQKIEKVAGADVDGGRLAMTRTVDADQTEPKRFARTSDSSETLAKAAKLAKTGRPGMERGARPNVSEGRGSKKIPFFFIQ